MKEYMVVDRHGNELASRIDTFAVDRVAGEFAWRTGESVFAIEHGYAVRAEAPTYRYDPPAARR